MIELLNARTMLVIDGAGGAFSAFFLGVVLTQYDSFIDIHRHTARNLAHSRRDSLRFCRVFADELRFRQRA